MPNNNLVHALKYGAMNWKVFPCHSIVNGKCSCGKSDCNNPGKHPRTENGFKDGTSDSFTIKKYWERWPDANIGCATGAPSGLVVLDIDKKHGRTSGEFKIPLTACVKTGGGGEHFFFKHPGGKIKSTNGQIFGLGIDIKADGGYVILAPSGHISGDNYEWILDPGEVEVTSLPGWLKEKITVKEKGAENKLWEIGLNGVSEGKRNETATSMAGHIKNTIPKEARDTIGWPVLQTWNLKNVPPLEESELKNIWDSVNKYEDKKKDREKTQADTLLDIVTNQNNTTLFHDNFGDTYVTFEESGHIETWSCKSKILKRWLTHQFWKSEGKTPGSEVIKSVLSVLEAKAIFNGPEHNLSNRIAQKDIDIYYDLTNSKWQSVKITKDSWEIIDNTPILFKRYPHNKPQVNPVKNGDAKIFLNYVNIKDSKQKLLLLVYLISCFIPDFGHPMIVVFGSQGSAKTTLSKLLRLVIDPSSIETVSMPENPKELIQALAHHYFLFFDNVSYVSENASDILCRIITGGGFTKRELYTDDDDVVYNIKRPVGMNGINLVGTRPDLLDRSLLLELDRIEDSQRKQEKEIMDNFEKDLPLILGGIFDVLIKVLSIKPNIKLDSTPRMADFAIWGSAITEALGYDKKEFLNAYQENINGQTDVVLSESVIATAIISFMQDKNEWNGEPSKFYSLLTDHAKFEDIIKNYDGNWPKAPNILVRRINVLKVNLEKAGINFSTYPGKTREIIIRKITPNPKPVEQLSLSTDSKDDMTVMTQS